MKPVHYAEALVAGALLTAGYFYGLRYFGIGFGGGYLTLALTVPALAWFWALLRHARKDFEGYWTWFGKRQYHEIELYQTLWPGAFGALAFLIVTVWFKDAALRPAFIAGWLFPLAAAATLGSIAYDLRRRPRS